MRLCFTIICIVILGACSSSSSVVYYERFDFSQVSNYSFYDNDSAFGESHNLDYVQRGRIELAIEKNLAEQGFNYSVLNQADIIVTYHIVKKERDYRAYNKVVSFCSPCLKSALWVKGDKDLKIAHGGLIIDLVSPKTNRSVWRSVQPIKFKEKESSNKINSKIIEAVNAMLSQYPNKSEPTNKNLQ